MADKNIEEQRIKNLIDATNFREPEKIPVGIEVVSWPYAYAGVRLRDVCHDPEKASEAFVKFLDAIDIDYIFSVGLRVGMSYPYRALQAVGNYSFVESEDGRSIMHDQQTCVYMPPEDYDQYIQDPKGYRINVMLPKIIPAYSKEADEAHEMLRNAAVEIKYFKETQELINKKIHERDIITLWDENNHVRFKGPFSELFDFVRGIKNSLIDIRRYPEKVRAALDAIWEQESRHKSVNPDDFKGKYFPFNLISFHSESFLTPKIFDEFWMKYFIEGYGAVVEAGGKFIVKGEGAFKHVFKSFRNFPKGTFTFMLDEDDPFEAYKEIGDWCTLGTGIKVDLLKFGTKNQCVDYVKKCVDTFAPGGGFLFLPSKPLVYENDVKIENLLAVYDTINTYGKK